MVPVRYIHALQDEHGSLPMASPIRWLRTPPGWTILWMPHTANMAPVAQNQPSQACLLKTHLEPNRLCEQSRTAIRPDAIAVSQLDKARNLPAHLNVGTDVSGSKSPERIRFKQQSRTPRFSMARFIDYGTEPPKAYFPLGLILPGLVATLSWCACVLLGFLGLGLACSPPQCV